MAGAKGFEPPTRCSQNEGRCSIALIPLVRCWVTVHRFRSYSAGLDPTLNPIAKQSVSLLSQGADALATEKHFPKQSVDCASITSGEAVYSVITSTKWSLLPRRCALSTSNSFAWEVGPFQRWGLVLGYTSQETYKILQAKVTPCFEVMGNSMTALALKSIVRNPECNVIQRNLPERRALHVYR